MIVGDLLLPTRNASGLLRFRQKVITRNNLRVGFKFQGFPSIAGNFAVSNCGLLIFNKSDRMIRFYDLVHHIHKLKKTLLPDYPLRG